MKKIFFGIVVLTALLAFAGCSKDTTEEVTEEPAVVIEEESSAPVEEIVVAEEVVPEPEVIKVEPKATEVAKPAPVPPTPVPSTNNDDALIQSIKQEFANGGC